MKHDKPGGTASSTAKTGKRTLAATSAPAASRRALIHTLLIAAIIGVAFLSYSNSFNAPLVYDNGEIILKDSRLHSVTADHIRRILVLPYWETVVTGLYRPFTTLSYLFNYAVLGNGPNPAGYHWFNFILHGVNVALVYELGLALFGQIPAAVILSSVWAVHPVLTESVTNVVGRADLLAAFGVLAAFLAYRKGLNASGLRKAGWVAATALAVAVGMFSKENAIVVLAVIAIYDFIIGRGIAWRSRVQGYVAAGLPVAAFLAARTYVFANAPKTPFPFTDNPIAGAGFLTGRMTAVKVIGRYLMLFAWPSRLSPDYSYNEVPLFGWRLNNWEDWKAVIALIICMAAAVTAIRAYKRNKPLCFSIGFFFVTLAPVSNLVIAIGTIMGERLIYLPSVGIAAALVCGVLAIWRRLPAEQGAYRYAVWVLAGIVLTAMAARTYDRNADWLDDQRLWRTAVEATPNSYRMQIAAATSAVPFTREDWARAIRHAGRALEIVDGLPDTRSASDAYREAGKFYRDIGDRLRLKDGDAQAQAEAGVFYRKSLDALLRYERIARATDDWQRRENAGRGKPVVTYMPGNVYVELGRTYMRLSETAKARAAFEQGRLLEPNADLLEELASIYEASGEARKAAAAVVEALAVDSNRTQLMPKLVELYGQIDPTGCAVTREGSVPTLNVNCPLVHQDICAASRNVAATYARRQQMNDAAAIRRIAVDELGCAVELVN